MQADAQKVSRLIKTAKGQLDGILKMIEEDRYCIDISNQLLATQALLRKANHEVLHAHMAGCVKEAVTSGNPDEKIEEMLNLVDKMIK